MEPVGVETIRVRTADGVELEGDVLAPVDPIGAAVVCHPHPLYGGSRCDPVVATICRTLVDASYRVLRLDFRGSGGSTRTHGGGTDERLDVLAAIDAAVVPDAPFVLAGYSFGADIVLGIDDPRITRWVVAAPVLSVFPEFAAATDPRPKTMVAATHDQFRSSLDLANEITGWVATDVISIDAADHFFGGRLRQVGAAVAEAVA